MLVMIPPTQNSATIWGEKIESEDTSENQVTTTANDKESVILPQWLKYPTSSWVNGEIDNATWKSMIAYLYEKEIIIL